MEVFIRAWQPEDMGAMLDIWNEVVEDGTAFPQVDRLNGASGMSFFSAQSFSALLSHYPAQRVAYIALAVAV